MSKEDQIKLWCKGRLFELMGGIGDNDAKTVLKELLDFIDNDPFAEPAPQAPELSNVERTGKDCKEEPAKEYDNAKTYIKGLMRDTIKTCIFHKEENPSDNAVEYIAATVLKLVRKDIHNKKEETVSDNLETEIEQFFKPYFNMDGIAIKGLEDDYPKVEDLKDIARHFANWQKKQDQSTIELAEDHAMLAGMEKMKEQMMAKAVDVTIAIPYPNGYGGYIQLFYSKEALPFGDKLKVLVIKED